MRIFKLLLAFLCFVGAAVPAGAQTAEERSQLDWVIERGRLLFDLDRAAWVGTDDMLARVDESAGQGMRGYVVEPEAAAYIVTFFGGPEDAPVAFYRGRVENHRVVDREIFPADTRPPLTALQRRLAAVRGMAGQLGRRPCGDAPFNTAVIPPTAPDGPIDLYLLTPQVRANEYPLGGHYRFTIAADGSVQSSREFTRACMAMDPSRGAPQGARPAALMITHLLDPIPTEIHVFSSLTSQLPIYVMTGERVWEVNGNEIRRVER